MDWFWQIINAVHFLHSKKIFHKDLKPENILISTGGILKLADLGISAKVDNIETGHET